MKKAPIIWTNVFVFLSSFLVALIGLPIYAYYFDLNATHWIATALALGFAGMSITVGYHRLWSHRTYEAHPVLQFILAIGGAFALQNSALHWSSDHRVHHKFVDQNDKDPYSAKKGFWFSHIGWMLRDYQGDSYSDYSNVRDLQKNKIVMWQHNNYLLLAIITNFGIPIALGLLFNDVIGMLLTVGVLRLVLSHHFTFFINSLAHIWGSQPYTEKNTARDNGFLALLTYGEGYHNFHHIFETDYRNGIRWWQFDPSKWFIKAASYIGLTRNLRKVSDDKIQAALWQKQKLAFENKLQGKNNYQELMSRFEQEYQSLIAKLKQVAQSKKDYSIAKQKQQCEKTLTELKQQYQALKLQLKQQHSHWQKMMLQMA